MMLRTDTMIPRYTRPQMAEIWDPQTRYRIWFEIEAHAADAMAELRHRAHRRD
jgi:adenylosuccinate lyase